MISPEERYSLIIEKLRGQALTTIELENILAEEGVRCPDNLARTLNVMRRKGLIKGKVSTERGGWVWWVEE